MHTHEYEGDRLVRTVVTREVEWDPDERAWMLGLAAREAAECRRCGGDLVETTDYEHNRYVLTDPTVCLRCVALHASEETYQKHPDRAGMMHHVQRQDRPQRKIKGAPDA